MWWVYFFAWAASVAASPIDAGVCGPGTEPEIARLAKNGRRVLTKWGALIDANCPGVPREIVATRVHVESNGKPSAPGDRRIGERGLLQVTAGAERRLGFAPGTRNTSAGNLRVGCLRLHRDADAVLSRWPHLDHREVHVFGQLPSAIGSGSAARLFAQVTPETYGDFLDYVTRLHAAGRLPRMGSQKPSKVMRRIRAVCVIGAAAKRTGMI